MVNHFRGNCDALRGQWIKEMAVKKLLEGLNAQEIKTESTVIYNTCVNCLASGTYEGAKKYAQSMAEKGVLRSMTTEQIIGGMLTLRDIYGRSLCEKYRDPTKVADALSIYEPVANKILSIVAMAFVNEKTKALEKTKAELEEKVSERTMELQEKVDDLEKFNRFGVDRELKMVELKKKINELEAKLKESGK